VTVSDLLELVELHQARAVDLVVKQQTEMASVYAQLAANRLAHAQLLVDQARNTILTTK